jgi:hypothetical protein
MSIDKKIAELLAESKNLDISEDIAEEFASMSLEELEAFIVSEDFEQLDELSKSTLTNYVKKATTDYAANRMKMSKDGDATAEKRRAGVKAAKAKMEEETEIEEELKVDVTEDVAALVNGEELSEEFKAKAATIFEAAVVTRVKAEVAKLEEQFESRLQEEVEEIKDGLVEKVDGYLNYVVEQWMTDNEIALENGLKNEIMEGFISGMKNLFQEHYIEVPEEKFDVLADMQEQMEEMKAKLDEQLATNVEMKSQLDEMVRKSAIEEIASEMVDIDAEKFRGLAEELAFEDAESFSTKLQTIKENYFGQKQTSAKVESVVTDSPVEELTEETKQHIDPRMQMYLSALKSSQ